MLLHKVTKNSVQSSEKRGVELKKEEDEEYSAPTKLTQSMRLQSELYWQQKSFFLYHWPGNSLPAEHFIQEIYWKKWHDSNSTLEYVHNHKLPAMVAQRMVTARLHHVVNVMHVARNATRLKQRGHQVHDIIISWDTQITPENCPLSDEYSPQHPSELLWATLKNCRLYCHWWSFPF